MQYLWVQEDPPPFFSPSRCTHTHIVKAFSASSPQIISHVVMHLANVLS